MLRAISSPSSLETSASRSSSDFCAPPRERCAPARAPTGHRQGRPAPSGADPRPPGGRHAPAGAAPPLWRSRRPWRRGRPSTHRPSWPSARLPVPSPRPGFAGTAPPRVTCGPPGSQPGRTTPSPPNQTPRCAPSPDPPRLLQRLIPIDERCANPLDGGGARRGLPLLLQELVAQGLRPVRQPAVLGPQGLRERVESVALLPEFAELGVHLVEGAVLVAGAVLELLPLIDGNQ
jgi:hypothetical protein